VKRGLAPDVKTRYSRGEESQSSISGQLVAGQQVDAVAEALQPAPARELARVRAG
jgi:hypothetical protein